MSRLRLEIDSLAHGGAGVGRDGGRVVFCTGGVPGDAVEAVMRRDRGRFLEAEVATVLRPSTLRREPPCPVFDRCGGCDWQMISLEGQRRAKAEIVRSQLRHLGDFDDPPVGETRVVSAGFRYRNRIDLRVWQGRPALYEARSHRAVPIEDCPLVLEPIAERIAVLEPPEGVDRVTIRASAATGELVEMARRDGRWQEGLLHEVVGGHRFQVSGRAFFQVNTAGAEALVEMVTQIGVGPGDTLIDGYAGGGLFSATVGALADRVVAVESDRRALGDLAVNAPHAAVISRPFEKAELPRAEVAVVDPPRRGLGADGVAALLGAGPERLAYVSCDPASLARDLRLLANAGFLLDRVTPVDMFPQTHHVEAVALLNR